MDEVSHCRMLFHRMPQVMLGSHIVVVPPPDFLNLHKSLGRELSKDALDRSLRDAHHRCEVTNSQIRIACQANQHMRVVGKKSPTARLRRDGRWRSGNGIRLG